MKQGCIISETWYTLFSSGSMLISDLEQRCREETQHSNHE